MNVASIDQLRKIKVFSELSDDQLTRIAGECSYHAHAKNVELIKEEDKSTDVYCVLSGVLRVAHNTTSGREIVHKEVTAGDIVGEMAALDGHVRSASVYALSPVQVLVISGDSFSQMLYENSALAIAVAKHLVSMIRFSGQRIVNTSSRSAKVRLLRLLTQLSQPVPENPQCAEILRLPSHRSLSGQVNCTRETVTRLLQNIEEDGLIKREKNRVLIPDIMMIEHLISEEE